MSKKQVLALTTMVAAAVLGLLATLVLNALSEGANMFSGFMTVVVALTFVAGLFCLFCPVLVMVWYPEEGLASLAPPPAESPSAPPPAGGDDDFDDEEEAELGADSFDEDEFEDDDEFYDDSGEFDEDEDW